MKKIILIKIILLLTFFVFSVSLSFAAPSVVKGGYCMIDGKWIKGTLMSGSGISIIGGIAYLDPPWSFVGDDGTVIGSNSTQGEIPWVSSKPENKVNVDNQLGIMINDQYLIITGKKAKIEIYDVLIGDIVFEKEKESTMLIAFDNVIKYDTPYVLKMMDEKGDVITFEFIVGSNGVNYYKNKK